MSQKRIDAFRSKFKELKIDSALITNPYDVFYLSGFTGMDGDGYLIITEKKAFIITDSRYTVQAKEQCPEYTLKLFGGPKLDKVSKLVATLGVKKMGVQDEALSFAQYSNFKKAFEGVKFSSMGNTLTIMRMVKDDDEIEIIKKACVCAWQSYEAILPLVKAGNREVDVAAQLELEMRKRGASKVSFDTILASGPRSAMPHGAASERVIKAGEPVTIDFGALYQGYCSDQTRTPFAPGRRNKQLVEIYKIVEEAHDQAIAKFKPGMTGIEVDKIARDVITKAGYRKEFGHGLGHGVGVEIHELPHVNKRGTIPLTKGMVFSIEPGIYVEGLGGVRIEDLGVVTDSGLEIITGKSK